MTAVVTYFTFYYYRRLLPYSRGGCQLNTAPDRLTRLRIAGLWWYKYKGFTDIHIK